ncbi:MAG: polymerase Rpb6 [Armatimonadetes bacterium]|nr:polymerase Rpb6 [Armatimonadota bacterium]
MILQSTDELEEYIGNKYSLVIVAAKRARQLKEGHPALSRDTSPNPLSVALREVQEHMLQPVAPPEEEVAPAPRDVIASLAGVDFDLDDDMDLDEGDAVDDLAALLIGSDEEDDEPEADREETDDVLGTGTATADADEEEEDETETDTSLDSADDDEDEADEE